MRELDRNNIASKKSGDESVFGLNWRLLNIVHNPFAGWIILAFSLMLTVIAYWVSSNLAESQAQTRFSNRANEITNAIDERLRLYEQVLRSGVAMMYSKESVSREDWKQFVEALELGNHWPGIQGLGFSIPVDPTQIAQHEQDIRAQGYPDFQVKPVGTRDYYTSIIYLEPFDWRNQRAFGYDMWSNEVRREAMIRATNSGEAATSGRITLVQETDTNVQFGFLTYVPVYSTGNTPASFDERQARLEGWVYAAFRAGDLMRGILGEKDPTIEFEIYDGVGVGESAVLFDTNDVLHSEEKNHQPRYSESTTVELQGRPWTIYLNTPEAFKGNAVDNQPKMVLIAGILIDILLFYVIVSLYSINSRAKKIADKLTAEYKQAKDKEAKANKAKSQFLANMSHELRTPLNSIIGFTQILKRKLPDIAEREMEALSTVHRNGQHLLGLINDILDLSKVEAGRMEVNVNPFELVAVLQTEVAEWQRFSRSKGLEFNVRFSTKSITMNTDHRKLQQIINNLVSNAVKYTDSGSVELEVSLEGFSTKKVNISVTDSGRGISQEDQKKLFNQYYRADSVRTDAVEGTGLGLVITAQLTALLGGSIEVNSVCGAGQRFPDSGSLRFCGSG